MPDMSNALMLIGATGERPVHLIFGQEAGDRQPFVVITITPEYVAHKISKQLPLPPREFARYINDNAESLMNIAASCRDSGKTGVVLTAKLAETPHNLICTLDHLRELNKSKDQPQNLESQDMQEDQEPASSDLVPSSVDSEGANSDSAASDTIDSSPRPAAVLTDEPAS